MNGSTMVAADSDFVALAQKLGSHAQPGLLFLHVPYTL